MEGRMNDKYLNPETQLRGTITTLDRIKRDSKSLDFNSLEKYIYTAFIKMIDDKKAVANHELREIRKVWETCQ